MSSAPQRLDGKFGTVAQSGVFLNLIGSQTVENINNQKPNTHWALVMKYKQNESILT